MYIRVVIHTIPGLVQNTASMIHIIYTQLTFFNFLYEVLREVKCTSSILLFQYSDGRTVRTRT